MAIAMTSTATSSYIPHTSPSNSNKSKVKTKIIKTYHHDICVTYDGLTSRSDSTSYDSDPEETEHLLSTMRLNSDRSCVTSVTDNKSDRATRTKYSIGGISAVDSGVVSHDSLRDRYQAMSAATRSERSDSPCSRNSFPSKHSESPVRGEFDPLNRTVLLDSKIRSNSRSRLEERPRGRSPCSTHGVKQMINFFEGSEENLTTNSQTSILLQGSTDPPAIKQPLHTTPLSPLRLSRSRRSSNQKAGTPTTALPDGTDESSATSTTRTKQENSLRLTCVASGYSKYSTNGEHKSYSGRGDGDGQSVVGSANTTRSTNNLNGARSSRENISANTPNGERHSSTSEHMVNGHAEGEVVPSNIARTDSSSQQPIDVVCTTPELNGNIEKTTTHIGNCSNNHSVEDNKEYIISSEQVDIAVVDCEGEKTTPHISNGCIDQVDRAELSLPLNDKSLTIQPVLECKLPSISITPELTNGLTDSDSINDSPSKKDGDWFLKVTDEAEKRLLDMCEIAEPYLELDLSEEVSGQIRAATGKAHLLVNKKFKQFRELCHKNLTQEPDEPFPTTSQDLAGFWDLVHIQIENCGTNFNDIDTLRSNGWVPQAKPDSPELPKKVTSPRGHKCIVGGTPEAKGKGKSTPGKPSGAVKARDEARKRLMAAKRAMRERKNSETEDVIFVSTS